MILTKLMMIKNQMKLIVNYQHIWQKVQKTDNKENQFIAKNWDLQWKKFGMVLR